MRQELDNLNNNLEEQPKFVYDEQGKITGYTTKNGGADTVFPFKSSGIVEELVKGNTTTYYSLTTTKDYAFIVAFIACPYNCQVRLTGVYENKYNYNESPRGCLTHTYVFTNVKAGTNIVASTTSTTNAMAYIVGIE